jgi:hypothetical protein
MAQALPKNECILHYETGIVRNLQRGSDWYVWLAAQGKLRTLSSLARRRQELLCFLDFSPRVFAAGLALTRLPSSGAHLLDVL